LKNGNAKRKLFYSFFYFNDKGEKEKNPQKRKERKSLTSKE
jgi:hypothetical protein